MLRSLVLQEEGMPSTTCMFTSSLGIKTDKQVNIDAEHLTGTRGMPAVQVTGSDSSVVLPGPPRIPARIT
jgi:hypothetical protein